MQKEIFESLETNLNNLIKQCCDNVRRSSKDFDALPLSEIRVKINNCKKLQSRLDRLLQYDLYHIIGMGDLTSIQMSKFIAKIKKLSRLRCIVKEVANFGEQSFMHLINIPQKCKYEVKNFNITLEKEPLLDFDLDKIGESLC